MRFASFYYDGHIAATETPPLSCHRPSATPFHPNKEWQGLWCRQGQYRYMLYSIDWRLSSFNRYNLYISAWKSWARVYSFRMWWSSVRNFLIGQILCHFNLRFWILIGSLRKFWTNIYLFVCFHKLFNPLPIFFHTAMQVKKIGRLCLFLCLCSLVCLAAKNLKMLHLTG